MMNATLRCSLGLLAPALCIGLAPAYSQARTDAEAGPRAPVPPTLNWLSPKDYPDRASLDRALQTQLRNARLPARQHLAAVPRDPAAAPASPPRIVAGQILTPTMDVSKAPGVPTVQVQFDAPGRLFTLSLLFTYPTGQEREVDFKMIDDGDKSGTYNLSVPGESWGLYAASGTWTLASAEITDKVGGNTVYTTEQLAAIFPSVTMQVTNEATPDITPPTVSAGAILTPVVHQLSNIPDLKMTMTVADDLSGAESIGLVLENPDGALGTGLTVPPKPIKSAKYDFDFSLAGGSPFTIQGTWTIHAYVACDVPGNCLIDSNPADITRLFGTTTFQVED